MNKNNKVTAEKPAKVKLTKRQRFDKYVLPCITFIIGTVALVVILGLAAKGLSGYLKDLSGDARTIAAIAGVSFLAYAVLSLIRLFSKA